MQTSYKTRRQEATRSSNRGFTLIELLVVIAIIAILASILFPVFARARANARRTSCLSNMKQIGLGILQYTQDYDEHMPFGQYDVPDGTPGKTTAVPCFYGANGLWWPQLLAPYTGTRITVLGGAPWFSGNGIYLCPELQGAQGTGCDGNSLSSYAANRTGNLMPFQFDSATAVPTTLAAVQRSSEIILLTESTRLVGGGKFPDQYAPAYRPVSSSPAGTFSRHFEGVNNLFVDGHVKWLKDEDMRADAADRFGANNL